MKNFLVRRDNTVTISGTGGTTAVLSLEASGGQDIIDHFQDLQATELEFVKVHKAKLIVRVLSQAVQTQPFAALLIAFLTDGNWADYAPSSAVDDQEQIEVLMNGFSTSNQIQWKIIGESKMSAPLKAVDSTNPYHEITFVYQGKSGNSALVKWLNAMSVLNDDPLTDVAFKADFALIIAGHTSQVFNVNSSLEMSYTLHKRPMATFARKKL